jgi:CheY-like chemotaxis protein
MKKLKMLIADDEPHARSLLGILVNEFCNEIYYARTGAEAVASCLKYPEIDIILIDKRMPEMEGFEAAEKIRSFNKEVIIIVLSAYHSAADDLKMKDSGCNDFLFKPVEREALNLLIRSYWE